MPNSDRLCQAKYSQPFTYPAAAALYRRRQDIKNVAVHCLYEIRMQTEHIFIANSIILQWSLD